MCEVHEATPHFGSVESDPHRRPYYTMPAEHLGVLDGLLYRLELFHHQVYRLTVCEHEVDLLLHCDWCEALCPLVAQLLEFIGDSPEERNLVAALAVDRPEKENELIILNDCVKTLEDISIKKEISQIRNQIRIAEDNNQSLDTSLIRKLEELQKKIS